MAVIVIFSSLVKSVFIFFLEEGLLEIFVWQLSSFLNVDNLLDRFLHNYRDFNLFDSLHKHWLLTLL